MIFQIALGILLLASFLCLYRIAAGPTAPDRTVAIDILGTLIVGFTCIFAVLREQEFYMNVAICVNVAFHARHDNDCIARVFDDSRSGKTHPRFE